MCFTKEQPVRQTVNIPSDRSAFHTLYGIHPANHLKRQQARRNLFIDTARDERRDSLPRFIQ